MNKEQIEEARLEFQWVVDESKRHGIDPDDTAGGWGLVALSYIARLEEQNLLYKEVIDNIHKTLESADKNRQQSHNYADLALNNSLSLGAIARKLKCLNNNV